MIVFFSTMAITCLILAMPVAASQPSFARFCYALFVVVFGIVLPLGVFLLSSFLMPSWKGECSNGWLDCFHIGKLTLAPLVLWATGALYCTEIKHGEIARNPGLILGHFVGLTIAAACFIYGCITLKLQWFGMSPFLLVPLYTAVWHGVRFGQALKRPQVTPQLLLFTFLGTIPFWFAGILWSRKLFASLSNHPPSGCFIVTAASHGHPRLVGPVIKVFHTGCVRFANPQLITLWHFEQLWREHSPLTHLWFRHIYNRVGPIVARRITSPWMADVVYVALKPAEWLARIIGHLATPRDYSVKSQPGVIL